MLPPRRQNAGQNYNMTRADRTLKNVTQLKYLGTTVTKQNMIQEEIKRRLNSGSAFYH
jgi:hypothetical protein